MTISPFMLDLIHWAVYVIIGIASLTMLFRGLNKDNEG